MGHERRFKRKSRTSAIPPITDIIAAPPPASAFDTRRRPRAGRLAFWPTVSSSAVDSPVRAIARRVREAAASTENAPARLPGALASKSKISPANASTARIRAEADATRDLGRGQPDRPSVYSNDPAARRRRAGALDERMSLGSRRPRHQARWSWLLPPALAVVRRRVRSRAQRRVSTPVLCSSASNGRAVREPPGRKNEPALKIQSGLLAYRQDCRSFPSETWPSASPFVVVFPALF